VQQLIVQLLSIIIGGGGGRIKKREILDLKRNILRIGQFTLHLQHHLNVSNTVKSKQENKKIKSHSR